MIRRRVAVVWSIVLALLAVIVAARFLQTDSNADGDGHVASGGPHMLLPVDIDRLGAVEVFHGGTLHRFERDGAGAWFYHGAHSVAQANHTHQTDPALAKRIEDAMTGFGRTRVEREFALEKGDDRYGVTKPRMIILIYARGDPRPLAQYSVGELAPDGFSRYVSRLASATVVTIANYQIDSLVGLIQAMNAPVTQSQAAVKP